MDSNIVNLQLFKQKKHILRYVDNINVAKNSDVNNSKLQYFYNNDPDAFYGLTSLNKHLKAAAYSGFISIINQKWTMLNNNLETNSSKFIIVGISNHYTSTLNHVLAYYNEHQKSILTLTKRNKRRTWVESFIKNKVWKLAAKTAIQKDINLISKFIHENYNEDYKLSHDTINDAIRLKLKLLDVLKILN